MSRLSPLFSQDPPDSQPGQNETALTVSPKPLSPQPDRFSGTLWPNGHTPSDTSSLSYVIISGGTGANSIASAFGPSPAFVLPVSDDGGSSAEILRCFGGPSIGDIRSRLIRLIPISPDPSTEQEKERQAIYDFFAYRFPAQAAEKEVREIWMEIVEGRSELWGGIEEDKKECIRAFLVHFQTLSLRRAHKRFSFRNFSLGNGFLTGARDLFGSLPSAIFLFKSIAGVNSGVQVVPAINTNQTVTIAAQLANSTTLVGQCNISHPTVSLTPSMPNASDDPSSSSRHAPSTRKVGNHLPHFRRDSRTFDTDDVHHALESDLAPVSEVISEEWSGGNLGYRKGEGEIPLEARIDRIFYINLYGQEIFPEPNLEYLQTISKRDVLVYSCGSLYTSIIPCLALRGLATAIATSTSLKARVILLNSVNDRETPQYTASEYITTILTTLRHYDRHKRQTGFAMPAVFEAKRLVSHVAYLEGSKVELDRNAIEAMGVQIVTIPTSVSRVKDGETPMFSNETVEWAMARVMDGV